MPPKVLQEFYNPGWVKTGEGFFRSRRIERKRLAYMPFKGSILNGVLYVIDMETVLF